ncbi:hypothetical protein CDL15_Pgr021146 [Punica granatum]|uniref:DYW domain-containing protein n=1 Tax=Punica granatum TaxID=22663 RepID=A0A218WKE5_PUNGR|nr:hypothetical protein CDL15_Pgr021146 [Punica granatum]
MQYPRLSVRLGPPSASALSNIPFDKGSVLFPKSKELVGVRKRRLKRYSSLLQAFASRGSVAGGRAVHGHLLRQRVELDLHLRVSLLNFYAKCGSPAVARRMLDEMPQRDVVCWTAVIAGFVSKGCGKDGALLFSEMIRGGVRPNEYTLATCLKGCSACSDFLLGKQVHSQVIRLGWAADSYVGSALMEVYAKCGQMELARSVYSSLSKQNVVLWNVMLNGYVLTGDVDEVMRLFNSLKESEIQFENFTLSSVLKCCASSGRLREGRILHCVAIKVGSETDNVIGCSLVDLYSKCNEVVDALKAFSRIKDPDVVTWTTIIACLDQQGDGPEAARVFNIMRQRGLKPNLFSLTSLVSAAGNVGHLNYGKSVHALIYKYGHEHDVSDIMLSNSLVSMYMKSGSPHDGLQAFDGMRKKDLVSFNNLLLGPQGPQVLHHMLSWGLKLNDSTFVNVLRCCIGSENVSFGRQVHTLVVKHNMTRNKFVGTTLIDMYAKIRCVDEAVLVFRSLKDKDIFTWTTIISGLMRCDQVEKGLKYFVLMQQEGITPNENTLATCLSGCSQIASLSSGKLLHSMALKAGHLWDTFIVNGLINFYGKCGSIEDAETMFKGLNSCDLTLWNSMICLYSHYCQGQKALAAFRLMLQEGILPDQITFLGVLVACSRIGLIDEGKMHFESMGETFGIETTIEHCACMVDMLGRAGKFSEVESFIKEMKIPPSGPIWEALLGACEMHKNENLGERAAERLLKLDPEEASNYILLSNIFAAKKRWDSVKEVRGLMTRRGVKKERACSWIEIEGTVHVFYPQDFSHPKLAQIYVKLEELGKKLILAGYKPRTEYVLQNVSDSEQKEYLHHHSERLALAFALMSSSYTRRIRIFKNNRICGDCHEMMRMISDIIDREIIIRDAYYFHNFRKGVCSCQGSSIQDIMLEIAPSSMGV